MKEKRKKKYKMGFNIWGLILFFIIMIPNFIWFAIPAPNDVLRKESVTAELDMVASVCQILIAFAICAVINRESQKTKRITLFSIITIGCCMLYFGSWIFYYAGIVSPWIILGLCIFPCFAFLFYALDRKNMVAVVPITIFTICHLVYGIVNFIW